MRILHCSDFHANKAWFDWLAETAADFDLACLTGDHLDLLDLHRIEHQLRMVRAALGRVTSPLALCSGNNDAFNDPSVPPSLLHATWLKELRRPGLWVDGDDFELGRLRFTCVGWNAPLPTAAGDEIWLYHAPPSRSPLSTGPLGDDVGDELLRELCRAGAGPATVLTGHQHEPRHWLWCMGRTWVLNPGRGRHVRVPNHIVIDTDQRTVALHRGGEPMVQVHIGYPA